MFKLFTQRAETAPYQDWISTALDLIGPSYGKHYALNLIVRGMLCGDQRQSRNLKLLSTCRFYTVGNLMEWKPSVLNFQRCKHHIHHKNRKFRTQDTKHLQFRESARKIKIPRLWSLEACPFQSFWPRHTFHTKNTPAPRKKVDGYPQTESMKKFTFFITHANQFDQAGHIILQSMPSDPVKRARIKWNSWWSKPLGLCRLSCATASPWSGTPCHSTMPGGTACSTSVCAPCRTSHRQHRCSCRLSWWYTPSLWHQ